MKYFPATSRTIIERFPLSSAYPGGEESFPELDPATPPFLAPVELHPLVRAEPTPRRATESSGLPPRILLVDDNAGVIDLVTQVLEGAGFQVCSAGDGESAWEQWNHSHFDLLITDHAMPRLTGLELLRRLRAAGSAVPSILMSGNLPRNAPDLALLLRPGALLEKPFSLAGLSALVATLLAHGVQSRARDVEGCNRDAERHAALLAHGV